jgi:molybdopterin synthase sulfur carrier subunit
MASAGGGARVPAVTVLLYGAFREFAGGRRSETVQAATVREALEGLVRACPELRERLRDEHGRLREHLNVFANDEEIRRIDGEATALRDGDVVHVIPAVSGGEGER